MGEYVKYKRSEVKIGTCESLYYVSYPKFTEALAAGHVRKAENNLYPSEYSKAGAGFLFRFPFPDEDRLKFGDIKEGFDRGVKITMTDPTVLEDIHHDPDKPYRKDIQVEFQKPVHRISDGKECLAIIVRNGTAPGDDLFRLEDDLDVLNLVKQLAKNNLGPETDPDQKVFYYAAAERIVTGYGLDLPIEVSQAMKTQNKSLPLKPERPKKKRGLRR